MLSAVVLVLLAVLFGWKILRINPLFVREDAVQGVDVSEYQGEIDWELLAAQGVDFAYIRASEGSGHTDACFQTNWERVQSTKIRAGAYHFFSFDSSAEAQAERFAETVEAFEGMLPPAIDVELYGQYKQSPKARDEVLMEIQMLSGRLEAAYGMKPLLYVTKRSYELYIRNSGLENLLWVRDVYLPPYWAEQPIIWQYTDRARLNGYAGPEKYIDMNVRLKP